MNRLRCAVLAACLTAAGWAAGLADEPAGRFGRLGRLQVLCDVYPRAFFFRASEGVAARRGADYAEWDATFSRLMGIQGKALDEEVPGRGLRNPDFFTRFKQAHPEQLVLLHYNGNARDPRFEREAFFAGHWLYYPGATILTDVPAEAGPTTIRVSDARRFHINMGRYRNSNDDIGLCALGADGRPDWHRCEQVRLVSVDRAAGTITVERGCYGTEPRAFAAGKAYAAAHVTEGPWGRRSHLMWCYNYSTRCPKDAQGRICADVHADELADRFAPGAALAAFDGVEFDVLSHTRARQADCNADGKPDGGFFDGVNTYGLGVIRFLERLRRRLGEDRLITADGHHETHQRGFGILNGIESEGWPSLNDREVSDWSGGLNRHDFWAVRSRAPVFNYINHKFVEPAGEPGRPNVRPDVPWHIHRLVLAAAMMTGSAVCYSYAPPPEKGERFGVWDELRMGIAHRLAYLGRPAGPPRHLAVEAPDTLGGAASPPGEAILNRLSGSGLRFALHAGAVRVSSDDAAAGEIVVRLRGVPCDGPDLVVCAALRAAPLPGYPQTMPRLVHIGIARPEGELVTERMPDVGMQVRGKEPADLDPATGATVRFVPRATVGGQTHPAYMVHPPFKGCAGAAFWQRDVTVPDAGRLAFLTGMGPKSPEKSDGVWFRVQVAAVDASGVAGPFEQVFEHSQKAFEWTRHEVPLAKWAGQRVRLRFVSDCGPKDHCVTDHSYWGGVWLTGPGGPAAVTRPVRFMTWADGRPFTSHAYFSDVRSKTVDLELVFEGAAPVWIDSLTAHAAPDAMVRVFEHGVVLANPSPRPQTFDLARLAPGRSLRRIQGSSRQDPETNNGRPVGATVTLPPKDGLFLVDAEGP